LIQNGFKTPLPDGEKGERRLRDGGDQKPAGRSWILVTAAIDKKKQGLPEGGGWTTHRAGGGQGKRDLTTSREAYEKGTTGGERAVYNGGMVQEM